LFDRVVDPDLVEEVVEDHAVGVEVVPGSKPFPFRQARNRFISSGAMSRASYFGAAYSAKSSRTYSYFCQVSFLRNVLMSLRKSWIAAASGSLSSSSIPEISRPLSLASI
jgi:hypothetical protein